MINKYRIVKEHVIRSIVSGIYVVEEGRLVEGVDQGNGYIRYRCLDMDMYIPIEKTKEV